MAHMALGIIISSPYTPYSIYLKETMQFVQTVTTLTPANTMGLLLLLLLLLQLLPALGACFVVQLSGGIIRGDPFLESLSRQAVKAEEQGYP